MPLDDAIRIRHIIEAAEESGEKWRKVGSRKFRGGAFTSDFRLSTFPPVGGGMMGGYETAMEVIGVVVGGVAWTAGGGAGV